MKKLFRILITILFLLSALYTFIVSGVYDFNNSESGVDLFKSLFFIIVGGIASCSFYSDLVNDRWPFYQLFAEQSK